eukprot:gnl/TRDRNA2_/TRDRNA2_93322_c0_seq1.p2 gnl/TRDRNA2_/TRDRNA2_93322_c0~~gnl/TRDRNA2_/TRDRNA2_93322_c0_seq1.p2  ORF type:complete len:123 (-),score=24.04 gnl/TRDRNA2_/TRDRNA2_93322_c0_seq1:261-629(-)
MAAGRDELSDLLVMRDEASDLLVMRDEASALLVIRDEVSPCVEDFVSKSDEASDLSRRRDDDLPRSEVRLRETAGDEAGAPSRADSADDMDPRLELLAPPTRGLINPVAVCRRISSTPSCVD